MSALRALPASELKDGKRAAMRVHGRTGETCPECGDVVREVSFADSVTAVLRDLPDRRKAARGPPSVATAEVIASCTGQLLESSLPDRGGHEHVLTDPI